MTGMAAMMDEKGSKEGKGLIVCTQADLKSMQREGGTVIRLDLIVNKRAGVQ